MGLFDSIKNKAVQNVGNAVRSAVNNVSQSVGSHTETVTLSALPKTLSELQAMPQADLQSPYGTVALALMPRASTTVCRCSISCAARVR